MRGRDFFGRAYSLLHMACDERRFAFAKALLFAIEREVAREMASVYWNRETMKNAQQLVSAHERLWELLHPDLRE